MNAACAGYFSTLNRSRLAALKTARTYASYATSKSKHVHLRRL